MANTVTKSELIESALFTTQKLTVTLDDDGATVSSALLGPDNSQSGPEPDEKFVTCIAGGADAFTTVVAIDTANWEVDITPNVETSGTLSATIEVILRWYASARQDGTSYGPTDAST